MNTFTAVVEKGFFGLSYAMDGVIRNEKTIETIMGGTFS